MSNAQQSANAESKQTAGEKWQNRIVGQGEVDPATLERHPENWRDHPKRQRAALKGALGELGWIQSVIVNKRTGHLIDGHCRIELAIKQKEKLVPVSYVDLSEEEERVALATLDPIGALATENSSKLNALLEKVKEGREELLQNIGHLSRGFRTGAGDLKSTVEGWKDGESFYGMSEWLEPIWAKTATAIVEFSGGKDSTGAALWAARHKGDRKIVLAFVDPGVEFPGMSAHIRDVAKFLDVEYVILKPKLDWWSWIAEHGWPSLLYRNCATQFIHKPCADFIKKHDPETTVVLTGSRAEEAVRGSKKTERSELSSLGAAASKFQHFAPCFAVTKATLEELLEKSGVPIWEGYSRGFVRTACWCCPGQNSKQALALQNNYPGLAEDIRRWEDRVGPMRPTDSPPHCFSDMVERGKKQRDAQAAKEAKAQSKAEAKAAREAKKLASQAAAEQ